MAPFRNTVSLVNSDSSKFFLGVDQLEALAEPRAGAQLRRNVQETSPWVPRLEVTMDSVPFSIRRVAVERARVDA